MPVLFMKTKQQPNCCLWVGNCQLWKSLENLSEVVEWFLGMKTSKFFWSSPGWPTSCSPSAATSSGCCSCSTGTMSSSCRPESGLLLSAATLLGLEEDEVEVVGVEGDEVFLGVGFGVDGVMVLCLVLMVM